MKLLSIDTSSEACSAALFVDGEITDRYEFAPRCHGKLLLPMVDELLSEAELSMTQLDRLAFGKGPGSFTGLRIAASVIQGFAFAADLPIVPVSTLQALAQRAYREYGATEVLTAIDARMNEIYWGTYKLNENNLMSPLMNDSVCDPNDVPAPRLSTCFGIGTGWATYQEILRSKINVELTQIVEMIYPHARDIACLAVGGKTVSVEKALPVYLRDKVAEKKGNHNG